MWVIALLGAGLLGLMVLSGSNDAFNMVAGKKYRVFWKVTPALSLERLGTFTTALTTGGLTNVEVQQKNGETVGSYQTIETSNHQVTFGVPVLAIQDGAGHITKVIVTKVEELP